MVRRFATLVLLVLLTEAMQAQHDASFSHYFDMEPSFNAASVGKEAQLNITGAYSLDFAGFEHNPQTMYLAADMPFYFAKSYHGVGVQVINDKIGLFDHKRIGGQYAYKFQLFKGRMSIGLQAALLNESFDGTKLDVEDTGDPAFANSQVNGNALDLGAGLYYTRGPLYAGLSVQHLNAPTITLGNTNELKVDRTYYFTAGYNIRLRNPFLTVRPSVLARTDGTAWRADATARLVYTHEKKTLYGGLTYSPTNSVTLLVGGSFHGVIIGYSYECYTSGISPGNGSHGIIASYRMDINLFKKGRNLHKSVRFL